VLKNTGNNYCVATFAVTQPVCHSVNATPATAKMAALQDSACDFDFQVKIGFFWSEHVLEIFLARVNFMFNLAEFFSALRMLFPEFFQRIIFIEFGWTLFGYAELRQFFVPHDSEVSG
jgi:hypothetical protein